MATRGFEYHGSLIAGEFPIVKDLPVDGTGAYAVGDLCLLNSDGQLARVTGSTTEVSAVIQEARASGSDGGLLKAAIITRTQIWRCSMDATSTTAKVGYTKTIDTVDHNTIDADDLSNGAMILYDTGTDDDGNVLAYVIFADTTFGNA